MRRLSNGAETLPAFVISLDFELMWGVRDHRTVQQYGPRVLGVRDAVPRMLETFEKSAIRATWATVGFLFCESKDELLSSAPTERPTYSRPQLSNYSYFPEIGADEKSDPYFFGATLLRQVMSCPGQEIGTHTFSHYYCLEPGQTGAQFAADLDCAIAVARRRGVELKSLVFPRNQYAALHLEIAREKGLRVFRGNERAWFYEPVSSSAQTMIRRLGRLADQYVNLSGDHARPPSIERGMTDIAASRFLRPYSRKLQPMDGLRIRRTQQAMTAAAKRGDVFHVWWHPHNFGLDTQENLAVLRKLLAHFGRLQDTYGMRSASMGDFVAD